MFKFSLSLSQFHMYVHAPLHANILILTISLSNYPLRERLEEGLHERAKGKVVLLRGQGVYG